MCLASFKVRQVKLFIKFNLLCSGRVRIDIKATDSFDYILTHVKKLNVTKTRLTKVNDDTEDNGEAEEENMQEMMMVENSDREARIVFDFSGDESYIYNIRVTQVGK